MKRIAVLADIHGNVDALTAVLQHAGQKHVDAFINLGDILYGPVAPKATFALLQQVNMVTVSGNQDRFIYAAGEEALKNNSTLQFVRQELDANAIDWLKALPFDRILHNDFYLCHGTPQSDEQYLLEDVTAGYPVLKKDAELDSLLAGIKAKVILCGHSHLPHVVQLPDRRLVVNPGSVGLPAFQDDNPVWHVMENRSPRASYALLDKTENGWCVELIQIPYNYQAAVALALQHNRPDWALYLEKGIAIK